MTELQFIQYLQQEKFDWFFRKIGSCEFLVAKILMQFIKDKY